MEGLNLILNYVFGSIIILVNVIRVIDALKAAYLMWIKGEYAEAFSKYLW